MIRKSYKYRLYPNKEQEIFLNKCFGQARFVYNWALDKKIKYYKENKKSLLKTEYDKDFRNMRNNDENFKWLNDIPERIHSYTFINLENAYNKFFKEKKRIS